MSKTLQEFKYEIIISGKNPTLKHNLNFESDDFNSSNHIYLEARLKKDLGISITDEPSQKIKEISVTIFSDDNLETDTITEATLGYTPKDPELTINESIWLELRIPKAAYSYLENLIRLKGLFNIEIGLLLNDLYILEGEYYPNLPNSFLLSPRSLHKAVGVINWLHIEEKATS